MAGLDLAELFLLSLPLTEIVVRGTAVYWFLFLVFRFVVHRNVGSIGVADLLLLVIIADASSNAMTGGGETIGDGLVLVSTLIGWNMLLDWLSYRFPAFERFAEPAPLRLVRNGRMLKRQMRQERLTEKELMQKLREEGVESLEEVKAVYLEADGKFSVIQKKPETGPETGPETKPKS